MASFNPERDWERKQAARMAKYYDPATDEYRVELMGESLPESLREKILEHGLKAQAMLEREKNDRARAELAMAAEAVAKGGSVYFTGVSERDTYGIPSGDAVTAYTVYSEFSDSGSVFTTPAAPKAPIHKEGHFPTHWMEEAIDRAEQSEKMVSIGVVRGGVFVTAVEGEDKYASHTITWTMMENAEVNPLVLAIEDVERKLDLFHKIKETLT